MSPCFPLTFKVVLVGATGVGKSSILLMHKSHTFSHTSPTLGCSFTKSDLLVSDQRVQLQIWDTAGQERFRSMKSKNRKKALTFKAPLYYRNAEGALAVYDISCAETFEALKTWIGELKAKDEKLSAICILANKCDLSHIREVPSHVGRAYAESIGASFFETSAKTNSSVDEAFTCLARMLIETVYPDFKVDENASTTALGPLDSRKHKCC